MTRGSIDNNGYYVTTLTKDGISKRYQVHRLVALTYIPNPENKPQVNHLDENKTNNNVDNLVWATAFENNNWGTRNARAGRAIAEYMSKKYPKERDV